MICKQVETEAAGSSQAAASSSSWWWKETVHDVYD